MTKITLLPVALAALLCAGTASAKPAAHRASLSAAVAPERLNTGLAGKIGVGFDRIAGDGSTLANALGLRYWATDQWGFDAGLSLRNDNRAATGFYGADLGARYNWKKPAEFVLVQLLAKASLATRRGPDLTTFTLFAGTGFEAFIPAWPALTVEANVGLGMNVENDVSGTDVTLGTGGSDWFPGSIAVHYYF